MLDETPNMIGIPDETEEERGVGEGSNGHGHVREILATMGVGTNKPNFGGRDERVISVFLCTVHAVQVYIREFIRKRHSVGPLVQR